MLHIIRSVAFQLIGFGPAWFGSKASDVDVGPGFQDYSVKGPWNKMESS